MNREAEVRYIGEADYREWITACRRGFLRAAPIGEAELATAPQVMDMDPARTLGAFDDGTCVGTLRSIPRELTVPGGTVAASGVTAVTVTTTHRRRGLLSRMMERDLAAARERDEPVAILLASEYPIYGRFGFGPATWNSEWTVDVPRARPGAFRPPPNGRIDLVDGAELRRIGPEFHERMRRSVPGAINRPPTWWRLFTGDLPSSSGKWTDRFHAVYRDASGRMDGMLGYSVDDRWEGKLPQVTLTVHKADSATPEAEAELWRYAMSVDWVTRVVTGRRAPDDVLPMLLGDPRAARLTTHADALWLRVLDVVKALQARTYAVEGSLVLRLHDAAGHAGGTYLLQAATEPGATRVTPITRSAELAMDIRELGALYLGDESAVRLAVLGRVEELRPGAAARADTLMRTSRRPWCPDVF